MDALEVVRLELWIPVPFPNVCAGCAFLGSIGPLAGDVGPQPPLHVNCRCRRERIDLELLSPWEKIRLALWADRNRRAESEIRRQALTLYAADKHLGRASRR